MQQASTTMRARAGAIRKVVATGWALALLLGCTVAVADEGKEPTEPQAGPEMPAPVAEHAWLAQLVGEWDTEVEAFMGPGEPTSKAKGTETGRMIGGFWAVLENRGDMLGTPFTGILTIGYDPEGKRYKGTWVDSMSSLLWIYTGNVDASGKVLTLETEGPCPLRPGELTAFREVIEVKSPDHKVFTSQMQVEGEWITILTIHYHRKK